MPGTWDWDYTLYIPNDPRAVTVCRRTLRAILTLHGLAGLVETAELLATELVSNAVRHTKGPAALRVRRSPQGLVWIGAWDTDPAPPEPPVPLGQVLESEEGGGWAWWRPVLSTGAGSRRRGSGSGGSTCGVSWGWREGCCKHVTRHRAGAARCRAAGGQRW